MGTTDIFLLVIIVSVLITGFFWGAARSLMLLAAWLLAFLAGAYLQLEFGSYLASQWTDYAPSFSQMAAYGLIFSGIIIAAPFVIFVIRAATRRSRDTRSSTTSWVPSSPSSWLSSASLR